MNNVTVFFRLRPDYTPEINVYKQSLFHLGGLHLVYDPMHTVQHVIDVHPFPGPVSYDIVEWVDEVREYMIPHAHLLYEVYIAGSGATPSIIMYHPEEIPYAIALEEEFARLDILNKKRMAIGGFVNSEYFSAHNRYYLGNDQVGLPILISPTATPLTVISELLHLVPFPVPGLDMALLAGVSLETHPSFIDMVTELNKQLIVNEERVALYNLVDYSTPSGIEFAKANYQLCRTECKIESIITDDILSVLLNTESEFRWSGRVLSSLFRDSGAAGALAESGCEHVTISTNMVTDNPAVSPITYVRLADAVEYLTDKGIEVTLEAVADPPGCTFGDMQKSFNNVSKMCNNFECSALFKMYTPVLRTVRRELPKGVCSLDMSSKEVYDGESKEDFNIAKHPTYLPYTRTDISMSDRDDIVEAITGELGDVY